LGAHPDPFRFTTIGHVGHDLCSPLSEPRLEQLVEALELPSGGRMLDLAGGKGALARRVVARWGGRALVVDRNPYFLAEGRAMASPGVGFLEGGVAELASYGELPEGVDLVACIGARPWGTRAATLTELFTLAGPEGRVLVGEGYWRHAPDPAFAALLGEEDEADLAVRLDTHPAMAAALGFELSFHLAATEAEFCDYDGRYQTAIEAWVTNHPEDPEAPVYAERIAAWGAAMREFGATSLGFGWYLYRRA